VSASLTKQVVAVAYSFNGEESPDLQIHLDACRNRLKKDCPEVELTYSQPGVTQGGTILESEVLPRIARADKLLAIFSQPNANIGFELGVALGLGKGVDVRYYGAKEPTFLKKPPFVGIACRPFRSHDDEYDSLLTQLRGPDWLCATAPSVSSDSAPGKQDDTLLLCAPGTEEAVYRAAPDCNPRRLELAAPPVPLHEFASQVLNATRLIWVIFNDPEERHGALNTRHAIFAGFFLGTMMGRASGQLADKIRVAESSIDVFPSSTLTFSNVMSLCRARGYGNLNELELRVRQHFGTSPSAKVRRPQAPARDENLDRQRVLDALAQWGGNQTRAAQTLGVSRRALLNSMDALGISRPRGSQPEKAGPRDSVDELPAATSVDEKHRRLTVLASSNVLADRYLVAEWRMRGASLRGLAPLGHDAIVVGRDDGGLVLCGPDGQMRLVTRAGPVEAPLHEQRITDLHRANENLVLSAARDRRIVKSSMHEDRAAVIAETVLGEVAESLASSEDGRRTMCGLADGRLGRCEDPGLEKWAWVTSPDQVSPCPVRIAANATATQVLCSWADGRLALWEPGPKDVLAPLPRFAQGLVPIAMSPDGKLGASAYDDGTLCLWDTAKRRFFAKIAVGRGVTAVAMNEAHLVCGFADGSVGVWDLGSSECRWRCEGHESAVTSIDLRGDDVFSASDDRTVKRWRLQSQGADLSFPPLRRIALTGGDRCLAGTTRTNRVIVGSIRPSDRSLVASPTELTVSACSVVAVSPNVEVVLIGESDGFLKIWRPGSAPPQLIEAHRPGATYVGLSSDGSTGVSGGQEGGVLLWDLRQKERMVGVPIRKTGPAVTALAVSGDGNSALWSDGEGNVRYWLRESSKVSSLRHSARTAFTCVALSSRGQVAVAGTVGGDSIGWRLADGIPHESNNQDWPISGVAVSDEGWTVLACDRELKLEFWSHDFVRPETIFTAKSTIESVSMTDGGAVACTDALGRCYVLSLSLPARRH